MEKVGNSTGASWHNSLQSNRTLRKAVKSHGSCTVLYKLGKIDHYNEVSVLIVGDVLMISHSSKRLIYKRPYVRVYMSFNYSNTNECTNIKFGMIRSYHQRGVSVTKGLITS